MVFANKTRVGHFRKNNIRKMILVMGLHRLLEHKKEGFHPLFMSLAGPSLAGSTNNK